MFSNVLSKSLHLRHVFNDNLKSFISGTVCRRITVNSKSIVKDDEEISTTSLHVIGNGSEANPCAVCLSIDEKLYLFNCGEGLQRLFPQYKLKVSKIDKLFLTSNKWRNISGISGLVLNRFDSRVNKLDINSIDCQKLIDFIKCFDIKLSEYEFGLNDYRLEVKPFVDQSLEVMPFVVKSAINDETIVSYVCKMHRKLGQLLIDRCFQMKIPRKLLPKLLSHQSVVLEDGVHVTPEQVLTPSDPIQAFVVLECPSTEFLRLFLQNKEFLNHLKTNKQFIECVVHMTPEEVIHSHDYQSLLQEFTTQTKHLVLNEQNHSFGLHSLHRTQYQLNSLDSKVFPFLSEEIETNKQIQTFSDNSDLIKCQTGLQYVFRPSTAKGLSYEGLEEFVNEKHLREDALKEHNGNERQYLKEYIKELKAKQQLLENSERQSKDNFPEVVFLGTGSAQPLVNRNVTGILVNLSADTSIMLDCGEDTFGQLFRYYGSANVRHVCSHLKAVFVSHIHSDHHMGLIRLILKHFQYTNAPLVVFIPPMNIEWLDQYCKEFEDISGQYIAYSTTKLQDMDYRHVLQDLGLKRLTAIPVIHCLDSFGVLLETNDDKRIVFSGDCEPSDELIVCGKDCDLLIHEATQEDALVSLARHQCHSTVSEAIDVGRRMNAKFTVLTHFSARYGKTPIIPDNEYTNDNIGIAYDFMTFKWSQLKRLPALLPVLRCLYATNLVKLKHKEVFRKRKLKFEM